VSTIVEMAAASDRGRVRARNEDCVGMRPLAGLAIVADGMGGHNAGEVASRMAVDLIAGGLETVAVAHGGSLEPARAQALIAEQIERANAEIYAVGGTRSDYAGMGTTVVVGLWYDNRVSVGHVGDSRMYRLRAGALEQLTRDHSLVQEQIDRGTLTQDSARKSAIRSILTRAVGSEPCVYADMNTYEAVPDDIYLLCSDGLTEMLSDDQIGEVLAADRPLQHVANDLVQKANARGGVDNISVIVVRLARAARTAASGDAKPDRGPSRDRRQTPRAPRGPAS
jgi:serine/threonine protein phosphatase PrpC